MVTYLRNFVIAASCPFNWRKVRYDQTIVFRFSLAMLLLLLLILI